jgi:hypothetical protein
LAFPSLKPGGPDAKLSWYTSKRFTTLRRKLGITRPRVWFHSLRKFVVTNLENAQIAPNEAADIIGHEKGFTYGTYSVGLSLGRLREIIEVVAYNGAF